MKNRFPRQGGYTLPELGLVAAIIGLLAGMATIGILRHRQNAEDVRTQGELQSIYKAMEAYRMTYGRYPTNYTELSEFISIPNFSRRYRINSGG